MQFAIAAGGFSLSMQAFVGAHHKDLLTLAVSDSPCTPTFTPCPTQHASMQRVWEEMAKPHRNGRRTKLQQPNRPCPSNSLVAPCKPPHPH